MIKKAVVLAMFLLAIYNIAILVIKPAIYIPQNQFQENVIKGQEYLYSYGAKNYVIVGSSLSTKLDMNLLPDNFFNLSFRGQSIYEGLEIIKKSRSKPQKVFIETNRYFKNMNKEFNEGLFTPGMYILRENIPTLQERYRPVNSLTLIGFNLLETIHLGLADKLNAKLGIKTQTSLHEQRLSFSEEVKKSRSKKQMSTSKELIKTLTKEYRQLPAKDTLKERIALLESYIQYLEKENIEVIFFEIPIEEELCSAPKSIFLRDQLYNKFPHKSFRYLPLPECKYFATKDGLHLDDESAKLYTQFLLEEIRKL